MRRRSFCSLPAVAALIPQAAHSAASDDLLLKAMRDELKRSMRKLQLENLEKPYFLSYRLLETTTATASATFGASTGRGESRRRVLATECRVGSYELDNTNFYSARNALSGVIRVQASFGLTMPLDDDYDEIRRQLWLSTDAAYKQALDEIAKKRAALENRTRTGVASQDFSKEEKVEVSDLPSATQMPLQQAEALAKQLSALFREAKGIDYSGVRVESGNVLTRYVNSEGSESLTAEPGTSIQWFADAQANDGMPITDVETLYFKSAADVPSLEELSTRLRAFSKRIIALRDAAKLTRYTGPVLFESAAAAEMFAQGFASALIGSPRVVVDDTRFEGIFAGTGSVLADKIGARVLPSNMRLTNDPTLANLAGSYAVDDEGVKARPTTLVQNGILKRLLNTRALVPGVTDSTASRRVFGPAPSNLVLESSATKPLAELKQQLIQLAKDRGLEFAVIVRKIANPTDQFSRPRSRMIVFSGGPGAQSVQISPVVEAVKVFPDGREELLRNIEISGFTTAAFRDLVGMSSETFTHTAQYRPTRITPFLGGAIATGKVLATYKLGALLFEDILLQQPAGEIPKLPFVAHPSFA